MKTSAVLSLFLASAQAIDPGVKLTSSAGNFYDCGTCDTCLQIAEQSVIFAEEDSIRATNAASNATIREKERLTTEKDRALKRFLDERTYCNMLKQESTCLVTDKDFLKERQLSLQIFQWVVYRAHLYDLWG